MHGFGGTHAQFARSHCTILRGIFTLYNVDPIDIRDKIEEFISSAVEKGIIVFNDTEGES